MSFQWCLTGKPGLYKEIMMTLKKDKCNNKSGKDKFVSVEKLAKEKLSPRILNAIEEIKSSLTAVKMVV